MPRYAPAIAAVLGLLCSAAAHAAISLGTIEAGGDRLVLPVSLAPGQSFNSSSMGGISFLVDPRLFETEHVCNMFGCFDRPTNLKAPILVSVVGESFNQNGAISLTFDRRFSSSLTLPTTIQILSGLLPFDNSFPSRPDLSIHFFDFGVATSSLPANFKVEVLATPAPAAAVLLATALSALALGARRRQRGGA